MRDKIAYLRLIRQLKAMKGDIVMDLRRSGRIQDKDMSLESLEELLLEEKPLYVELRPHFAVVHRHGKEFVKGKDIDSIKFKDII